VVMIIFSGIVIKMSSGPRRGRFFGRRLLGSAGISAMVVLWLILAGWERPVLREYDKAESLFRHYRSRGEIKWEPILAHYRRSIEADPGFLNPYLRLAQIARGRGRLRLALRYYRNLLEQAPGRIDLRREIASIYREMGESEKAEEELLACLEFNPENVLVRNQLAEFYWASGRPEKAIRQLEESLRIKKDKRVMEQLRRIRQLRQAAENDK